jgi:hypothetical protein
MPLIPQDFKTLVGLLGRWSGWQSEADRRALLDEALRPSPRRHDILGQLVLDGRPHNAAVGTVSWLDQFGQDIAGREMMCLLIDALKRKVGRQERDELEAIAERLDCPVTVEEPTKGERPMLPPENIAAGVGFLFEIGRWAKSELSEIWKLRRKEKEVELSKQETVSDKAELQSMLTDAVAELGDEYTRRVLDLIEQNRSLYLDQEQRIPTARDQFNQGNINAFVRDNIFKDAAKEKVALLREIERLAAGIGLTKE